MWFRIIILTAIGLLADISAGHANPLSSGNSLKDPVNFAAKSVTNDESNQTVTALGDVELVQGGQILRADKIIYYLAEDKVTAIGGVSLLDAEGNIHFAEVVELHNKMKDGFIKELLTLLADGSRFTATEAKRENGGTKTTMTNATYTVCKVCEADPQPLWQIKASEVVHDATVKKIHYKNARMELLGVPLIYAPIFSHADPTMKRKSGFLRPQYGWTAALGGHLNVGYYYDIAPDRDMTVHVEPTTLAGTLLQGEWRERFVHGQMKINGSTVNSDRKEEDGSLASDRQRGHIFATGRFDLDDKWRAGFDVARASDKQYLRLYDISKENVLSTQAYAERFSGRDYSRVSALNFQDVRLGIRESQPDIFPMMEHSMIGEPGALWGGRWHADIATLGLTRTNNNQDVQRGSVSAGWERRDISAAGVSTMTRLDGRGDYYGVQNSDAAKIDPLLDTNPVTGRGMATATLISSYPLVKTLTGAQALIEPLAGISLSPKVDAMSDVIPNEDSIDVQFDNNNLFAPNRFPGGDRQEDGGRINYGVKTGLYGDDGRYGNFFLGQSYRFYGDPVFPAGSGLEQRRSDFVGQLKVGLLNYLEADYRFQVDSVTLDAKRHEIQAGGGDDRFRLNSRFMYLAAVAGTGFAEARQQIQLEGSYNITKNWKFSASELQDFGDQPGLRNATVGLDYADECFTLSVQGSRNVADTASGDNDTKLLLRIGFKNIGEFTGPKIPLGGREAQR